MSSSKWEPLILIARTSSADFSKFASRRIDQYLNDQAQGKTPSFPTIMERLLIAIPEKGYQVPSKTGLRDEILTIVSAGDDTTAIAILVTIFNIISNPEIHSRLMMELQSAMPSPQSHMPYLELEQLPYLVRNFLPGHTSIYSWELTTESLR